MEQEEIKKAILERFNNLQPEIQAAIMDTNYEIYLDEVGKKHNLTLEQMADLELNTTLVMLGQTHPDEYKDELIEDLELPEEKITEIVNDINEKILKPIIVILRNNFEEDERIESEFRKTPLPPYALLPNEEKKAEIVPNTFEVEKKEIPKSPEVISAPELPKSYFIPKPMEEKVINNEELIIKNEKPVNIMEEKMKGATVSVNTVSDHSAPKIDPYREAF
jgi:cell fate (sporulation/competence/biofilm development) regulator YlbF (YheA/YmcA/DUF963 family)